LKWNDETSRQDAAFHHMAEALAQKNRENEMFVYSVSHDLRSPLVNLEGFSQELSLAADQLRRLLADGAVPAATREQALRLLDRDVAGAVGFICTAVGRLSAILDGLLKLSRAGRVEHRPQVVDVAAAVGRVVRALNGSLAQRGAEVTVNP